jgi:hypothetical protein
MTLYQRWQIDSLVDRDDNSAPINWEQIAAAVTIQKYARGHIIRTTPKSPVDPRGKESMTPYKEAAIAKEKELEKQRELALRPGHYREGREEVSLNGITYDVEEDGKILLAEVDGYSVRVDCWGNLTTYDGSETICVKQVHLKMTTFDEWLRLNEWGGVQEAQELADREMYSQLIEGYEKFLLVGVDA